MEPSGAERKVLRKPHRVWTPGRRLMGNVLPMLIALPPAILGVVLMITRGEILGLGLALFAVSPVLGWIATNYLGLFQNKKMKRELELRLRSSRQKLPSSRYFVGIATPTFKGLIDPHEDVGFLILHGDEIEFWGDSLNIIIAKQEIRDVRFRPNIHTLIGLGRWVSIEGEIGGKPVRLAVEVRDRSTLIGNLRRSKALRQRLLQWLGEKGS
ncbi:MAG TPA: hypothetical protein VEX38_09665 [Fimbriimonadaceae bacterium]|nr:hypothetical protein [Fimbriimonadaceae bacterium]